MLAFWSPLLLGDRLTLELTLPAGSEPQALDLDLARVSHLLRLPFTLPGEGYRGPDDCHVDLACVDDPLLERLARATAVVLYTRSDGGSNACTGTLLADADPETRIPYLVTAHHCIPDQARASSVVTVLLRLREEPPQMWLGCWAAIALVTQYGLSDVLGD